MQQLEHDKQMAAIHAEYKAVGEYYTAKGEKLIKTEKRMGKLMIVGFAFWTWFFAFILCLNSLVFFKIVTPPPDSAALLFPFHDIAILASLVSAFMIAYPICRSFSNDFDVPITHIPSFLVFILAALIVVTLVAIFQNDFTLGAQWFLCLSLVQTLIAIVRHRQEEKELEKIKQEAREKITKELEKNATTNEGKSIHHCSICQQESLYDLCLTCEETYRTERHRIRNQILRAKKANVEASLTLIQWLTTLSNFHWRCAYCQTGPYQVMEHYVPVTQGGGTTVENCVPACFKCNSEKAAKHPEKAEYEWLPRPPSPSRVMGVVKKNAPQKRGL